SCFPMNDPEDDYDAENPIFVPEFGILGSEEVVEVRSAKQNIRANKAIEILKKDRIKAMQKDDKWCREKFKSIDKDSRFSVSADGMLRFRHGPNENTVVVIPSKLEMAVIQQFHDNDEA